MLKFIVSLLFLLPTIVHANTNLKKESMKRHILSVGDVYSNSYAPAQWKNKHSGWSLDSEIKKALNKIDQRGDIEIRNYHTILKDFFRSMEDYHVGFSFHQTEAAKLPITVKSANGKYYIVYVDREKLSNEIFPAKIGDELISFANKPVQETIDALTLENGQGVPQTDQAISEMLLFNRSAAKAMIVPRGPVELRVKHRGSNKEKSYQLMWEYTPEEVVLSPGSKSILPGDDLIEAPINIMSVRRPQQQSNLVDKIRDTSMHLPNWKFLAGIDESDSIEVDKEDKKEKPKNPFRLGARKSFIPDLGPIIWSNDKDKKFHAYIYKGNKGKLIGYVRIPHYDGSTEHFNELKEIIKKYESVTDALVIDQINNPGGSLFYIYGMMSILSPDLIYTPRQHIKLDPSSMAAAAETLKKYSTIKNDEDAQKILGKDWDGYPVGYQTVQYLLEFARFTKAQWNSGKTLTEPTYVWGVDKVNPNKDVNYTKPILVLTNELDFSGGDFFPAILQDNKRATIMGVRTAGAGGFVKNSKVPNSFGLKSYSFTGSLAKRVNNQPIENLGVVPDIHYEMTEDDYTNNFTKYKEAINKNVMDLIK